MLYNVQLISETGVCKRRWLVVKVDTMEEALGFIDLLLKTEAQYGNPTKAKKDSLVAHPVVFEHFVAELP
jgi:hypothetical protein